MYWDAVRNYWLDFKAVADESESPVPGAQATVKPMRRLSPRRTTVPVCVTGMGGAGKTVLYESLIGKVGNDYIPPGRSTDAEPHRTVIKNTERTIRAGAVVVPGQESEQRTIALAKMFEGGNFPAGVIHVTCWGYNKIWEAGDRAAVSERIVDENKIVDMASVCNWNKRAELEDFKATCDLLKDAWEHHSQLWLIVAVAKCDLFWSDLDIARDYYIPGKPSPPPPGAADPPELEFRDVLRDLVQYIGEANCKKLAVVPVICYPETYKFDRTVTQQTNADSARTAAMVNQFRKLVGEFCGL